MKAMSGGMGAGTSIDMDQLKQLAPNDILTETGPDRATAQFPGLTKASTLVNDGGRWLIDPASVGLTPAMLSQAGPVIPAMQAAIEQVTTEVEDGQHASIQAVVMSFGQKLQGAIQPPDGGGGGG
jgi:hypothetical protein